MAGVDIVPSQYSSWLDKSRNGPLGQGEPQGAVLFREVVLDIKREGRICGLRGKVFNENGF